MRMKKEVLYPIYVLVALLIVVAGILFFVYKYGQENIPSENTQTPITTSTSTYTLTPAQVAEKQQIINNSLTTQKVTLTKTEAAAKLQLLKKLQGSTTTK